MSVLSQFAGGGQRPPKVLVNNYSTSGWVPYQVNQTIGIANSKTVLSGAMTAGVLKTLLSVSGAGSIEFLSLMTMSTTARTMRIKLTIDGQVAFDSTSATTSANEYGAVVLGSGNAPFGSSVPTYEPTLFNTSLLIEVASSITETDKFTLGYKYRTF